LKNAGADLGLCTRLFQINSVLSNLPAKKLPQLYINRTRANKNKGIIYLTRFSCYSRRDREVRIVAEFKTDENGNVILKPMTGWEMRHVTREPGLRPPSQHCCVIHLRHGKTRPRLDPCNNAPASYSAQFFTLNFILGMWWRRELLCLFGMEGEAFQYSVPD
jgi:hypothetical protein